MEPSGNSFSASHLRPSLEEEMNVDFVAWQLNAINDARLDVRSPAERFILQLSIQPHFFDIMMKVIGAEHIKDSTL